MQKGRVQVEHILFILCSTVGIAHKHNFHQAFFRTLYKLLQVFCYIIAEKGFSALSAARTGNILYDNNAVIQRNDMGCCAEG